MPPAALECTTSTRRSRCTTRASWTDAAAAADKAIAADPKRADAYYIKGQALIPKATVDAKTTEDRGSSGMR